MRARGSGRCAVVGVCASSHSAPASRGCSSHSLRAGACAWAWARLAPRDKSRQARLHAHVGRHRRQQNSDSAKKALSRVAALLAILAMSKISEEVAALGLENLEVVVKDLLGGDGLARDLPYVSTALKLLSITRSVSDAILARKLKRFFDTLHRVPDEERVAMHRRLLENAESAARVGEVMLLTIDRLNGLDKAKWAALAFIGHLDGVLTLDELRRVLGAIEQTIPSDLEFLVAHAGSKPSIEARILAAFVPIGLAVATAGGTWGANGNLHYGASEIGKKLADVHRKWWAVLS